MDAVVAIQATLTLVEPQSSGLGGGAFLLYWDAGTRALHTYDGRETAPAAATPAYFLKEDGSRMKFWEAVVGGRSVGVPGAVGLLALGHERHGRLAWRDLFGDAIDNADKGFIVTPRLAASIARAWSRGLDRFETTRAYFSSTSGAPLEAGETLRNPAYAETLRRLAAEGPALFYTGDVAREIVATVRAAPVQPGILTLDDFARYRALERAPVCSDYRGHRVCGMGPPTSGGLTVGQILGLLEGFDLAALGPSAEAAHLFMEASKLAYADRARWMADSDFVPVPAAGLLDRRYLAERASLIDPKKAGPRREAGTPPGAPTHGAGSGAESPGTTHFVVRDRWGNAASMTASIETGFGSRLMAAGFLLNNELTDFDRSGQPVANRVEGGKRPRSSMAPTIVFRDGAPVYLVGSPGGSRIIGYVAQALLGLIDFGQSPQEAAAFPHWSHRNGKRGDVEDAALKAPLEAMGHEVKVRRMTSGLHIVAIRDGMLTGGADPRREGVVLAE